MRQPLAVGDETPLGSKRAVSTGGPEVILVRSWFISSLEHGLDDRRLRRLDALVFGDHRRCPAALLGVGDELVVRIVLRTDRDMEYVHMKDQRGSGTEPVNVLSRYRYQDGLAYYESTRDTASHFFIDYLPKGTYVFEYSVRVQHKGRYQTGMAQIQCMYAPEFNSHSESIMVEAK